MSDIRIRFRDGKAAEFKHENRPGGSYTNRVELTAGWVTVIDVWGVRRSYPSDTVDTICETPTRF